MKTLDEFLKEIRGDVDLFEAHWRKHHAKNPKHYPMSFPEEDVGMWWEQFLAYQSMNGKHDG